MAKLRRRETIKLGGAVALLGPSVLFCRSAKAQDAAGPVGGFRASNFKVGIEGLYHQVPDVVAVDLGGVQFDNKSMPHFGPVSIALADSKAAPKLQRRFGRKPSAKFELVGKDHRIKPSAMKISVSLYGKGGKKPALTYHALKATPDSAAADKWGRYVLKWNVRGMQVQTHKLHKGEAALAPLPESGFAVEVDKVHTTAMKVAWLSPGNDGAFQEYKLSSSSKGIKWGSAKPSTSKPFIPGYQPKLHKLDGADKTVAKSGGPAGAVKLSAKALDRVRVSTYVTPNGKLISQRLSKGGKFYEGWPCKWKGYVKLAGATAASVKFSKAQFAVSAIHFPKVEIGRQTLVTESYEYKLSPGGA